MLTKRKKILILSQVYYPDTVSVAQHLSDFCEKLVAQGHLVEVIASRYGYYSSARYESREVKNGVIIRRVPHSNFSRENIFGRVCNFVTFLLSTVFFSFLTARKSDLVVATSVPPFMGTIGLLVSVFLGAKFRFWLMDIQPQLAFSAGLVNKHSFQGKVMEFLARQTVLRADRIVVLDRFMSCFLKQTGVSENCIRVSPVWPVSEGFYAGGRMSNPFRAEHDYGEKIVVMYSGNHALVHPLDTVLGAALALRHDERFLFSFVGGGLRERDVTHFKKAHALKNIRQHEFQPRTTFHISIGASDLQVVIMGEGQVGYTHPNKIYGALLLGKPILYVGPEESHVADILKNLHGNIRVRHGEIMELTEALIMLSRLTEAEWVEIGMNNRTYALTHFGKENLINKTIEFFLDEV